MLGLVWQNSTGPTASELPARYLAVRSEELANRKSGFDVLSNLAFAATLNREQRAEVHISANPRCLTAVRRQGAWRLMLPVSTQCHRDRGAGRPHIGIGIHAYHRVVGERIAHELILSQIGRAVHVGARGLRCSHGLGTGLGN